MSKPLLRFFSLLAPWVQEIWPARSIDYADRIEALRKSQRWDEAERALRNAFELFPGDVTLTFEQGWLLLDTAKLDAALALWTRAASMAADQPDGAVGLATTLRRMSRFEEADAALAPALSKFPDACYVFSNYAVNADERGDRPEALRRWQEVFSRFPREPIAYAGLGAALKMLGRLAEADQLFAEGMASFPNDANVAINHAEAPVGSGDWSEAIRRWSAVNARWPNDPTVRAGFRDALVRAALAAADAGDEEAAQRRLQQLVELQPEHSAGYAARVSAFRKLNRWDEAARALRGAFELFPGDLTLNFERGWLLLDTGELDAALALWTRVASTAADQPEGCVGLATTLRRMGRFDEADAALAPALSKFPDACFVFTNYAVNADERGDRREALRRWRDVFSRFRHEPIAYAGVGAALKMLGRFEEADRMLAEGMAFFPNDANVAINHAQVPVRSGDWSEAVDRWSAVSARWPDDPTVRAGCSEALMRARLARCDAADAAPLEDAARRSNDRPALLRDLMMRFESIGENCELGFVQRNFGAEPLGLFRWAGISFDALLEALESGLAGIGEAEHTELCVNAVVDEYFTRDRRYGMTMHTFISPDQTPPEVVLDKMCRRIDFLKRKMSETLRDRDKIFVFNARSALSDEDLYRLHSTLCVGGPKSLLYVAPDDRLSRGSVVELDARLWRGCLGRTGFDGSGWSIEFESWLSICRTVAELHQASLKAAG
jgi:tetratricopeptide (TPR) repeat protein